MEAYAQEIIATRFKGCVKNFGIPKILFLVSPKVLVGYSKEWDYQADLRVLCVVLEKSKGFWPMVQTKTMSATRSDCTAWEECW